MNRCRPCKECKYLDVCIYYCAAPVYLFSFHEILHALEKVPTPKVGYTAIYPSSLNHFLYYIDVGECDVMLLVVIIYLFINDIIAREK